MTPPSKAITSCRRLRARSAGRGVAAAASSIPGPHLAAAGARVSAVSSLAVLRSGSRRPPSRRLPSPVASRPPVCPPRWTLLLHHPRGHVGLSCPWRLHPCVPAASAEAQAGAGRAESALSGREHPGASPPRCRRRGGKSGRRGRAHESRSRAPSSAGGFRGDRGWFAVCVLLLLPESVSACVKLSE